MVYVRLYNDCNLLISEIEVEGQDIMDAICGSFWDLQPGDTIKIVEEEAE